MKDILFQYYEANIKKTRALGYVSLNTFIEKTKNPKDSIKEKFIKLKTAEGEEKARLKESLFSFTPSVKVRNERVYKDVIKFTGLLVLDFDKISNAVEFRDYLFETYDFVICAYTSPSRRGVKAICKIPVAKDIAEYKRYFYGMASIMSRYNGFDGSNQNCVLPLFGSYDEDIRYRYDAKEFNRKGIKENEYDYNTTVERVEVKITSKDTETVKKILENKIDAINNDGHPQVVKAGLIAGGYVGGGYLTEYDAYSILESKITQNSYLSKGTRGYLQTVKRFIKEGQRRPLYLKNG